MQSETRGSSQPESGRPRVSVIVPAYGRPALLEAAVRSLVRQEGAPPYEILVVDSSPDEENRDLISGLAAGATSPLRVYRKAPEGPGPSRNLGAREARGEILAFMDSDCQAAPGWVRALAAAFADPRVGLVQGRTLPEEGKPTGIFTWYVRVVEEGFIYEAANVAYRREAFDAAGGFPGGEMTPTSDSPIGGEDVELAWTVKRSGWESRFAGDAVVHHEVVPIPVTRWLFNRRNVIWPRVARNVPEIRRFFFARYFLDRAQAALSLGLVGAVLTVLSPWALLLWGPYVWVRGSEATRTLTGPLRILRVIVYLPRDLISFLILARGSLRFRSLVL